LSNNRIFLGPSLIPLPRLDEVSLDLVDTVSESVKRGSSASWDKCA
jgi:hypothetical protein